MKKLYPVSIIILVSLVCTFFVSRFEEETESESMEIADYFKFKAARLAGPTGSVEPADVSVVEQQIATLNSVNYKTNAGPLLWKEVGPDNIGGRTLGILADNQHPGWIYAGAAGGGLWLSKTNGSSWYHVSSASDYYENLTISSITQTPDGDIYFGTGEELWGLGLAGFRGGGVWRKDKDSTEFRRLNKTNPAVGGTSWNNTPFLAASSKRDRVYVGNEAGLYVSDDNGANWVRAAGTVSGQCTEVKADSDGTVMALIGKKIYISTNDGDLFTLSATGLPNPSTIRRGTIAIASKNTNYLYAVYAASNGSCYGAYRSTNKGASWSLVQLGTPYFNPFGDQGWYDICMAIDPEDENHVFVGGIFFWEWKGPGTNFMETSQMMHADIHNITIDRRSNPYTIILGTDGGVYQSTDRAQTFFPSNHLYVTTQFYGMGASRTDHVLGGTQDNGSLYIDKNGNTVKASYRVLGGDGFFSEIAWHDEFEVKIVESQYANLNRNRANSAMANFYDDSALAYIADASGKFSGSGRGQFSSPFTLWEHPTNDSISYFAIGVNGAIYFTKDALNFVTLGGPKWFKVASFSGNVNCVEFSQDGNMLYYGVGNSVNRVVGFNNAVFDATFHSNPGAHGITFGAVPLNTQGSSVQGIACDPKYPNRLLVTTGNYGFANHVFLCRNANGPASSMIFSTVQSNLPAFPCYDAAIDYLDSNIFIVGTEYGVYGSFNGGTTWSEQNGGMARVAVFQVRQYIDTRQPWTGSVYYLGTHGRGMFRSTSLTTGIKKQEGHDIHTFSVFPNPASERITIHGLHSGTVRIYDLGGKCVLAETLSVNESTNISALPKGTYIFELNEEGKRYVTKFVKM
jgi:hypothetical protein